ncbi:hypothetical protein LTR37_008416 [Vermiconidia calcicola]|uniref:Uncharacterized protein n=1 Tax=Vermiconidia calcicola TaxID=1690605 RepID=A0ACC3NC13_9PEZI|nr:hypothetical protein LTR37_008416 [Vermiconidia calcicola]
MCQEMKRPKLTTEIASGVEDQATSTEPNRLLKLPAELRNRIYELALLRIKSPQRAASFIRTPAMSLEMRVMQPPLACTCKQIRNETLPLFYSAFSVDMWNVNRPRARDRNSCNTSFVGGVEKRLTAIGAENRSRVSGVPNLGISFDG